MTSRMRKAVAVLGLTGALAVMGVTAGAGLAEGGPSPEQLADAGWTCFVPPIPVGVRCFNPAQGRPPIPPLGEDGRASYQAFAWAPTGEFQGHVHLIRADLYAGQPCAQTGAEYVFRPNIGYYECNRFN